MNTVIMYAATRMFDDHEPVFVGYLTADTLQELYGLRPEAMARIHHETSNGGFSRLHLSRGGPRTILVQVVHLPLDTIIAAHQAVTKLPGR